MSTMLKYKIILAILNPKRLSDPDNSGEGRPRNVKLGYMNMTRINDQIPFSLLKINYRMYEITRKGRNNSKRKYNSNLLLSSLTSLLFLFQGVIAGSITNGTGATTQSDCGELRFNLDFIPRKMSHIPEEYGKINYLPGSSTYPPLHIPTPSHTHPLHMATPFTYPPLHMPTPMPTSPCEQTHACV